MSTNLEMVQWMRMEQSVPWNDVCIVQAVDCGSKNLKMVRWMLSKDGACRYNSQVPSICARNGDLVTLQWLQAAGYPLGCGTAVVAAATGQSHLLAWLLDAGLVPPSPISPGCWATWPAPTLMLLGDHGLSMASDLLQQLRAAMV